MFDKANLDLEIVLALLSPNHSDFINKIVAHSNCDSNKPMYMFHFVAIAAEIGQRMEE